MIKKSKLTILIPFNFYNFSYTFVVLPLYKHRLTDQQENFADQTKEQVEKVKLELKSTF